jgi:predicted NBD/HSP70 family sugar kinase
LGAGLRELGVPAPVAVGLGLPAPIDAASGTPIQPPTMPEWDGFPLRERFSDAFGCTVAVDNDAFTLGRGELVLRGRALGGAVADRGTYLVVKVSSGISCCAIVDGAVLRGECGCAGDIGHMCIDPDSSTTCACGNTGCLEALASAIPIARQAQALAAEGRAPALRAIVDRGIAVRLEDVALAAMSGDTALVDLLREAGRLIGLALAALVCVLNPREIIVAGQFGPAADIVMSEVRQTVYRRSHPLAARDLRISAAPAALDAALVGASAMAMEAFLAG